MQTFIPTPDFYHSLLGLDQARAGKQRLEAKQIFKALAIQMGGKYDDIRLEMNAEEDRKKRDRGIEVKPRTSTGWQSHTAVRMWEGYIDALSHYHDVSILTWVEKGYRNEMRLIKPDPGFRLPWWLGNPDFHSSHRSNLIRKYPAFYGAYGWVDDPDKPYLWPDNGARTLVPGKSPI